MKKILLILIFPAWLTAQVGINTSAPQAQLDIKSSNQAAPSNTDGILIPKADVFPSLDPTASQDGMMVYLTAVSGINQPGFYYWSQASAAWLAVGSRSGWSLNGNSGTTASSFLGTTDDMPLAFRVKNVAAGKIDSISRSTFLGYEAGMNTTAALSNTAIGQWALRKNINGEQNTAVGVSALRTNVSGYANTAIGYAALVFNTGNRNTAVGHASLNVNSSGNENCGLGWFSLRNNLTGWYNVALGSWALPANQSGSYNVAAGYETLYYNNGSYNSAYGHQAGKNLNSGINNITCIGYGSGFFTTPSNHINIGNGSVTWIGGQTNWGTFSDARTKDNVRENVKGLEFIKKLRPVTYNFNYNKEYELLNEGRKDTTANWQGKYDIENIRFSGFIAQEAEWAAQQSGYDFSGVVPPPDGKGAYTMRYAEFVVPLVKAVQEQQDYIERLEKTLAKMEQRLFRLESLQE